MDVIGMSFGMMGFVFAMIAVSQLATQDARIKSLETQLNALSGDTTGEASADHADRI